MPSKNTNTAEVVQESSLDANLLNWQDRLNRLEAETPNLAGTNLWPEWYSEGAVSTSQFVKEFKAGSGDARAVGLYYQLYDKEATLRETISGRPRYYDHSMEHVVYTLGSDVLAKAIREEGDDGILHQALIEDIEYKLGHSGVLTEELQILQNLYSTETLTDVLGVSGDSYADKVRTLLRHENAIRWLRHNEEPRRKEDLKWPEMQEVALEWTTLAIVGVSGITKEEASNYAFSVSRNGRDEQILEVIAAFDHFGADRIRKISAATGIYGLEGYSIAELERMEEFANHPDAIAEKLQDKDVTVVLINRFGDHNGVMRSAAEDFDDSTGRVLYFEINHMDDVYRRMVDLHHAGIKPSTLVLSAHSSPGRFCIADDRKPREKRLDLATIGSRRLIEKFNSSEDRILDDTIARGFSMHGMKGMARLVDEYMRPSRSINDNEADLGRKKIIFQACDAGTKAPKKDIDGAGERFETGDMESVVGQLAKDLINSGIGSNIDVYGAPAGMQMHRTEKGVRYSGQPNFEVDAMERTPLHAVRMRVENGKLMEQTVDEIALRKAV